MCKKESFFYLQNFQKSDIDEVRAVLVSTKFSCWACHRPAYLVLKTYKIEIIVKGFADILLE